MSDHPRPIRGQLLVKRIAGELDELQVAYEGEQIVYETLYRKASKLWTEARTRQLVTAVEMRVRSLRVERERVLALRTMQK